MTRKEYTNEENDRLVHRTHVSVLAIIRHMHRSGPDGLSPEDLEYEAGEANAIPVIVGVVNAVMTFLMDDGGMPPEQAIQIMSNWSKTVADGKAATAWMLQPPQGTA